MKNKAIIYSFFLIFILSGLSACSDSSYSGEPDPDEEQAVACETQDEDSSSEACGKVFLGVTDADGDFMLYQVEVTGLELSRQDGTQVSVLTSPQQVDFASYIDLTELAAAATIPAGVYTSGVITINYANADIQVEKAGNIVPATMVDENGEPLVETSLTLQLDADNPLVIARGRAALLEVDFNLSASHDVNLDADPVTITTEPFITAEVDPVVSKEFRLRGPLIRVNEDESFYRIAVRPFHRTDGRFGGANVHITDETSFVINGDVFNGSEGLAELANMDQGTATVAQGEFVTEDREFTAVTVLAGSSVPGFDKDAARGVITARNGNTLTIHGATVIRTSGEVAFHQSLAVDVSDSTRVVKPRQNDSELSITDLSVGQAVTILGDILIEDDSVRMDATEGGVKMRLSFVAGHQVSDDESTLTLDLQALNARSPARYDFSGTGIDPSFDADPENYEVSVEQLMVTGNQNGDPIRVSGFVRPFGSAPADFNAISVIDYSEGRSQLYVDWPETDEVAFSTITEQALVINIVNNGEAGIYKLIQGAIRTDIANFESDVTLSPKYARGIYTIRDENSVKAFSSFADFTVELQQELDSGKSVDKLHAIGGFTSETLTLSVVKIAVKVNATADAE